MISLLLFRLFFPRSHVYIRLEGENVTRKAKA